ncbi:MAG TPA: hypothetical protein VFJ80_08150 [Candidatus Limnocylindrales bacterium]|jgi:hypothetical protein|nr:hypothetical protein [Candidatus Limnocylindrales bacterium]
MSPRRPIIVLAVAVLVVAAACSSPGTSGSTASGSSSGPPASGAVGSGAAGCPTTPPPQGTPAGWDVASQHPSVFPQIINPSGAIACGQTRLMFSFLDAKNVPVASPDRTVDVKLFDLGANPGTPVAAGTATFIWAIEPTVGVYVVDVDLPTAGSYGAEFTTKVGTGAPESIRLGFDVQPASSVIAVGDKAPASVTPTLADVGGDPARISTDTAPVKAFYETSIADAAASGKPFVVAFATPKFCVSKQCGPTLDRLKPIAARHPAVTFINVEPYKLTFQDGQLQPVLTGDPPQLTPTDATNEWHLPTEPWVFVVDRHDVVSASFMLIFSDTELEAALKAVE